MVTNSRLCNLATIRGFPIILQYANNINPIRIVLDIHLKATTPRGSIRSTRSLGPTMTARGQSIGILIGMLPQTLIISRLDQLW